MNLSTKRQKIFLGLLLLSGLFFLLETVGILSVVTGAIHKIFQPVQIALYKTGQDFKSFLFTVREIPVLREKESKLQMENSLLLAENAKLKLLEEENKVLREQLAVKNLPEGRALLASIIGKDPLLSASKILIDKGTNDGVRRGNLVVLKDILIGQVTYVQFNSSNVSLLSDSETKIPAITQGKAKGILKGEFGNRLRLTNVVQNQNLKENEVIFSSGEGGYPRGLVLGTVSKVHKDPAALFQEAEIAPLISYDSLETVFILIDE